MSRRRRLLLLGVPVAAGLALAVWLAGTGTPPRHEATGETPRAVRMITAEAVPVRPRVRGFGTAVPGDEWHAVARVAGEIVYRHPRAESGTILEAGTRLFEIDPADYELALAEARAALAALTAERRQLATEAENIAAALAIERERLAVAERELERMRALRERGSAAAAELDAQIRATLQQRQAVRALENDQRMLPARRERLAAEIDRSRTRVARAARDLGRTIVTAPIDLRVTEVPAELYQEVHAGETLLAADGVASAEVAAQVPVSSFRRLVGSVLQAEATDTLDLSERIELEAIGATLTLAGLGDVHWSGRVTRVSNGLDPRTRTVQVVVTVDEPYRRARPPQHPPLVRNMYVGVTLTGQPLEPVPVVPAAAVHAGEVYVVDSDDRLRRREVTVAFRQADFAAIGRGLSPGERVVVDDVVPAIDGMRLAPQPAPEIAERIAAQARGEQP